MNGSEVFKLETVGADRRLRVSTKSGSVNYVMDKDTSDFLRKALQIPYSGVIYAEAVLEDRALIIDASTTSPTGNW